MDINKFPLFDPNKFHDACGIGFIMTEGAKSYDSKTGDGAGILTDLPKNFFKNFLLYNYIDEM